MRDQQRHAILAARAKVLAQEVAPQEEAGSGLDVVTFRLAEETYAIELSYVREVLQVAGLTPVPCTPAFVLGIISVRGQILSVIDLKQVFGLSYTGSRDQRQVMVLHRFDVEFGILTEAILGVQSVPLHALQPSLSGLRGMHAVYLKGVTSERLVVLDAERLLSDPALVVHDHIEPEDSVRLLPGDHTYPR